MKLTPEEEKKQIYYRDARTGGYYGKIWTSVGKCVFCDLRDKYIVFEENGIVMTVAMFAYIDGNLMIIPRRHIKSVKELTSSEWATIRKCMYMAKKMIRKVHDLPDIQYIIRDGGVKVNSTVQDHLHIHCVPFDAPDLNVWNYRKLKYTPFENAELFRNAEKSITKSSLQFNKKYAKPTSLQVFCDLVITNSQQEVLLEEKKLGDQTSSRYLTLPGGVIDANESSFEAGLAHKVLAATGLTVDQEQMKLIASRIAPPGGIDEGQVVSGDSSLEQLVWNTYKLQKFDEAAKLRLNSKSGRLVWVKLAELDAHSHILDEVKQAIRSAV